jgi:hypothetical protein
MNDNNGTSNKLSEFALHKNIFVKMADYEHLDDLEQGEDGNGGGDYEVLTRKYLFLFTLHYNSYLPI